MRNRVCVRWISVCTMIIGMLLINTTVTANTSTSQEFAGTAGLLKDIDESTFASLPGNITPTEQGFYFTAIDSVGGLWFSDGTTNGTRLVRKLAVGPDGGSGPSGLTTVGEQLFFSFGDGRHGSELWTSDGTEAGTFMVADLFPGQRGSDPNNLTDFNDTLFFLALSENNMLSLWKSDGSPGGVTLVKELVPDNPGTLDMIAVQDTLYIIVPIAGGAELWRSDGTPTGTMMLKRFEIDTSTTGVTTPDDVQPMIPSIPPDIERILVGELTDVNGTLFFRGYDGAHGYELWRSDGTQEGTQMVIDATPGVISNFPRELTVMGNAFFYVGVNYATERGIWSSDGTEAGTREIRSFPRPEEPPSFLTVVDNTLFFSASDDETGTNRELWKSDGTTEGTQMVKDIWPGAESSGARELVNVEGVVFFSANDGQHGTELWKSDGTEAGTTIVKDIFPTSDSTPMWLTNVNGTLFFAAKDRSFNVFQDGDVELWRSDGTEAGTQRVKDINTSPKGSEPDHFVQVGDRAFFIANDELLGLELWQTDGTTEGTQMVKDIAPGIEDGMSRFSDIVAFDGKLFFSGDTQSATLWRSDGTEAGTELVLGDEVLGSSLWNMLVMNDTLYFTTHTFDNRSVLWASDGTANGTVAVKQFNAIGRVIQVNGSLWFSANDGQRGTELWRSDGTEQGTVLVKDIWPGPSGEIGWLVELNDGVLFTANDGQRGTELWRSDGTEQGTVLVKDIKLGSESTYLYNLTSTDGRVFLIVDDGVHGEEVWVTDGTEAGTRLLKDIKNGSNSSEPRDLTAVGRNLFFSADDGKVGRELWTSDGTEQGTVLVSDIRSGPDGSDPRSLTNIDGLLFFSALNDEQVLWRSDGTRDGTQLVWQEAPGQSPAYINKPSEMFLFNDSILLSAYDEQAGQELWSIRAYEGVAHMLYTSPFLGVSPASEVNIPVHYVNMGRTVATDVQLTATIDEALTYVSDTSDHTPAVSESHLFWELPDLSYLERHAWTIRLQVPEAPYGTRYTVMLQIGAAQVNHADVPHMAHIELMVARQIALPLIS
ncbi:MAG: hypothetical protein GFH25_541276n8 [Chloroflexi bacterium AL-N10]|nr:hypothetical protein [Chloroflexi bacterium AL-N1]NOK71089.1 hypothetical protein [Chloroflexi bacterium AL-N10]NOK77336.1 hypothetical protein [Chloroflexi bacterium AL-N5]